MRKRTVSELTRLAFIYAEQDRLGYADAVRQSDPEWYTEAMQLVKEMRAYRMKRWGKSRNDALEEIQNTQVSE